MKLTRFKIPYGVDWSFYIIPLLLTILGIVIIFSVTYQTNPGLTISQIIYVLIGFALAIFLTFLDYRVLSKKE